MLSNQPKDVLCIDQPYVEYFNTVLANPPSSFHQQMATAVLSMYQDLAAQVASMTYYFDDVEYIRATYPRLFAKVVSRGTPQGEDVIEVQKSDFHFTVYPIAFSVPAENIQSQTPPKSKAICRVIPGHWGTYFRMNEEDLYRAELQQSLFAYTFKKAGWDCMRHYEILAAGSLPLFLDLSLLPAFKETSMAFPTTLALHPLSVYSLIVQYPSLAVAITQSGTGWNIDLASFNYPATDFDKQLYTAITMATLQYTRNVFSTTSMAQYLLRQVQRSNRERSDRTPSEIQRVLFLSNDCFDWTGDYIVDTLLHGFKQLLGEASGTVVQLHRRPSVTRTMEHFDQTAHDQFKSMLYGGGMTFGLKLNSLTMSGDQHSGNGVDYDVAVIDAMVQAHVFDLVIYASAHRRGSVNEITDPQFFTIWQSVCNVYARDEVALVDGSDEGIKPSELDVLLPCASHVFTREGIQRT